MEIFTFSDGGERGDGGGYNYWGLGVGGGCQKLLKIAFGGVTRPQKLF